MNTIVIIGANGFLGMSLASYYSKKRSQVLALIPRGFTYGGLKKLNNVDCQEFDFETLSEMTAKCTGTPTIVYHLAWAGVSSAKKNEFDTQLLNIEFAIKAIDFAKKNGIKRVLFPGSASEYSCGNGVIDGKQVPAPSDIYSATKVAVRYITQVYAKQRDVDTLWTSITSIYGPGRNDDNLITYCIKTLLKGEKPLFTGLEQIWDYIYIDDLVKALAAVGESGKPDKIYPIGSGVSMKMSDYVKVIRDKINPELPIGIGSLPYKNKIIDNQRININELTLDTGFVPQVSFEEGIEKTIMYFRNIM